MVGVIAYGSDPRNATVFEGVSEGSSLKSDGSTELPLLEISSWGSESGRVKMLSSGLGSSVDRSEISRAFADAFLASASSVLFRAFCCAVFLALMPSDLRDFRYFCLSSPSKVRNFLCQAVSSTMYATSFSTRSLASSGRSSTGRPRNVFCCGTCGILPMRTPQIW